MRFNPSSLYHLGIDLSDVGTTPAPTDHIYDPPTPAPADAEQYAELLGRLLPPGPIWTLPSTQLADVLLGLGAELARIHNAGLGLLDEADPRTATQTIGAWEATVGLPDPLYGTPSNLDERRALAHARLIAKGGQSAAYFVRVAAALGVTITIEHRFKVLRAGFRTGARCYNAPWIFAWIVNAPILVGGVLRAGFRAGDRVQSVRQPALEALLWRLSPAHTTIVFRYS